MPSGIWGPITIPATTDDDYVIEDIPDHGAGALLLLAEEDIPADRRQLADVYAASLGVWLRNVSLQDSLCRHQSTLEQQVADRTAELRRVNAGLQAANDHIIADLEVARVLQQSILPASFPAVPRSLGHAVMRAAQQIGGDFFNAFELGENRIVVVGDVCGKGVAAALFMGIARTILRNLALEGLSPATCLAPREQPDLRAEPAGFVPDRGLWNSRHRDRIC